MRSRRWLARRSAPPHGVLPHKLWCPAPGVAEPARRRPAICDCRPWPVGREAGGATHDFTRFAMVVVPPCGCGGVDRTGGWFITRWRVSRRMPELTTRRDLRRRPCDGGRTVSSGVMAESLCRAATRLILRRRRSADQPQPGPEPYAPSQRPPRSAPMHSRTLLGVGGGMGSGREFGHRDGAHGYLERQNRCIEALENDDQGGVTKSPTIVGSQARRPASGLATASRSEERRVGKECA